MKKFMKYSLILLLCSALFVPQLQSVTAVVADDSGAAAANKTFITAVQATAVDKPNKTMFFGLGASASLNPSVDALGYVTLTDTTPTYSGIAVAGTGSSNSTVRNSNITAVATVNNPTSDATRTDLNETRILFISNIANSAALPTAVLCTTVTAGVPTYRSLKDKDNTAVTVNTMTLVAGNVGTTSFGFIAVKDGGVAGSGPVAGGNGSGASARGTFGCTDGDGIACVTIDQTTNAMTARTTQPFDFAIGTTLAVRVAALAKDMAGGAAMYYDETLARLYVGSGGITSAPVGVATSGGDAAVGIWGVGMYNVDASSYLSTMRVMSGESGVSGALVLTGSNIVGAKGPRSTVAINKLRVMHTSTGPVAGTKFAYLIVNGGNGYINNTAIAGASAVGNRVWSVPLVVNPATGSEANAGKLANVNTANYKTVASAAGDLFLTNTAAARVGNGPLPCAPTSTPTDMWVDGDAVYCSIGGLSTVTNAPGIYVSQCCFNQHGQIDHWTEWCKVAPNEVGDSVEDGGVGFFSVIPTTGQIWAVDGTLKTALRGTNWLASSFDGAATPAADPKGLLTNLNLDKNMGQGCTAVCDLNSSTTAWGATTPQRIALFGNINGNVSFAKTGSCVFGNPNIVPSYPGTLTSSNTGIYHQFSSANLDYRDSQTLITTTVVSGKAITCLAYSGWDSCTAASQTNGFFFAGADEDGGLYVWANATTPGSGVGFNTRTVGNLNSNPFRFEGGPNAAGTAPRKWWKLDTQTNGTTRRNLMTGVPKKIVAEGGAVYVLTRGEGKNTDKIYRMTRQNNKMALAQDLCVTASAGSTSAGASTESNLSSVHYIYDFVVTVTTQYITGVGDSSSQAATGNLTLGEQLMMLTSDGIYTTTCSVGTDNWAVGKTPANSQLICGWEKMDVPNTADTWQKIIGKPAYTRGTSTWYLLRAEENASVTGVYDKTSLYALSKKHVGRGGNGYGVVGNNDGDAGTANWSLAAINAFDGTSTVPTGFTQLPRAATYYSDGSRRFFNDVIDTTVGLYASPFNTGTNEWNVTSPTQNFLTGTVSPSGNFVYWVSYVGDTGKLLAGTSQGVVGLA